MINNEVIESYLVCPYKAFLKFQGISGVDNLYIDYYKKLRLALKDNVISHKFKNVKVLLNQEINRSVFNTQNIFIDSVIKKNDVFELMVDILETRTKDNSIFIVPILIYEKEYISKLQKLNITILSLRVEEVWGNEIKYAEIIHGQPYKKQK